MPSSCTPRPLRCFAVARIVSLLGEVDNNLVRTAAGYNGGPGNVMRSDNSLNAGQDPLVYIASGVGHVEHNDKLVGTCGPGDFLGEMSAMLGEPATASVTVAEPMRIARFDRDALAELSRKVPELRRAFDHALNRGLAAKVVRMNRAASQA